jgi:peptidyl-prolyl cis-trans isomerase SurA
MRLTTDILKFINTPNLKAYIKKSLLLFFAFLCITGVYAQEKIIDQVVAVVGDNYVSHSDIEQQYLQYKAEGNLMAESTTKCYIFEEYLTQTLLLNQAKIDSVVVSEGQVQMQLDQRMNFFIQQIGSPEKLEKYFNRTIFEIKEDLRENIRKQLITQKMQSEIIGNTTITPSEVKDYYHRTSRDSLPFVDATVQINQIVKYPPLNEEAINEARKKLLDLRKRIIEGENFRTLAVLYSEGPSSAQGGELGFKSRAELAPEYTNAAFKLKEGGVSNIVKTEFGYHIIQLIEKKDNRVNTRHILIKPSYPPEAINKLKKEMDSIAELIRVNDSVNFEKAVRLFSEDEETKRNKGLLVNPEKGTSELNLDEFNARDFYIISRLKPGQVSDPYESFDNKGNKVYKIIRIAKRTKPHRANLTEDYSLIKNMALEAKKMKILNEWIIEKQKETFIRIDPPYHKCNFSLDAWIN